MKNISKVFFVVLVFSIFSCGENSKKETDDLKITDDDHQTFTDYDSTDDNSQVEDHDDDSQTFTDDDPTDDNSEVMDYDDEIIPDEDIIPEECFAPSEISQYDTKPYTRMRIYVDSEKIEEYETNDDDEVSDDDYENSEGFEFYFKSEYNDITWETKDHNMSAFIMPDFEDEDDPFNNVLFVEGFESSEDENDERWFIFTMDTNILKQMKEENINQTDFDENAMLVIKRDTETETMSKSCIEAVLKKGVVYACDHDKTNYEVYESLNLWIAVDLETDETEILNETGYDELCECHNNDGEPVDCDTEESQKD
ncbi:MAG: hypothetical protein R6W70_09345 [bacterium]